MRNSTSTKIPKLKSQQEVVAESLEYIKKRALGDIENLLTCYDQLNLILGGGFEWGTTCTISALSGGGKSTLSKRLMTSIVSSLTEEGKECVCLSFNFEMLAHRTVGREIAHKSKVDLGRLYSKFEPLGEEEIKELESVHFERIKDFPIYYIEEPQDYKTIGNTILHYWKEMCKEENKGIIIEIDHAVICQGMSGDTQKDVIDNLMKVLNIVKKKISAQNGKVFFIVLSQMNRDIKSSERKTDPLLHIPQTSDLFASSSMEFYSDYIIISHIPAKLNLKFYTSERLPTVTKDGSKFVYWHVVKNRDNEPDRMVACLENFKYFDFIELNAEQFNSMWSQFKTTKKNPERVV